MKHLEVALKVNKHEQSNSYINQSKIKSKSKIEMWSLDPDFIEEGSINTKQKFHALAYEILTKKFQNDKYIEELADCLQYIPSELQRLTRIEQTLHSLSQSFTGEMKNYLKHFQSLLDSKIRKIKRKQKRAQLNEFQKIVNRDKEKPMKRKTSPFFINEDQIIKNKNEHKIKKGMRMDSKSKKSFGTSNENQSGSGKNISGSDSKSGEANALAVLLANVARPDQKKKEKTNKSQKEQYDFSSIIGASITVRQRSPIPHLATSSSKQLQSTVNESKRSSLLQEEKDEAFIFHRPKPSRKNKC